MYNCGFIQTKKHRKLNVSTVLIMTVSEFNEFSTKIVSNWEFSRALGKYDQ